MATNIDPSDIFKNQPKPLFKNPSPQEIQSETNRAQKRFDWAVNFLAVNQMFTFRVLSLCNKYCSTSVPTMGVVASSSGISMSLYYNPYFVNMLSDSGLTYVLCHEAYHIALHHCTYRSLNKDMLSNIAHDLAVNELIPIIHSSCEIPTDSQGKPIGVFVKDLQKKYPDLKGNQTSEIYHSFLLQQQQQQPTLSDIFSELPGNFEMDQHDGWDSTADLMDDRITREIDQIDKLGLWGSMSGTQQEIIRQAQIKRIPWEKLLISFYGKYLSNKKESSRKKINRRYGFNYPGIKNSVQGKHLIVIDTSGSVNNKLASKFLAVINHICDQFDIDIMQCDSDITEYPHPYTRKKKEFTFKGRGGTNFQPIIDLVNASQYKSVVILTDGEAAICTEPKNCKVVWVLPEGYKPPVTWGTQINIPTN